jgi:hypothetical protein
MKYTLALALILASCAPKAKAPVAIDVATTAIVLTDDVLAVAISVQPKGYDREPWAKRVAALKAASDALEMGQSLCPHISALQTIAGDISCAKCSMAITAAKDAFKCP